MKTGIVLIATLVILVVGFVQGLPLEAEPPASELPPSNNKEGTPKLEPTIPVSPTKKPPLIIDIIPNDPLDSYSKYEESTISGFDIPFSISYLKKRRPESREIQIHLNESAKSDKTYSPRDKPAPLKQTDEISDDELEKGIKIALALFKEDKFDRSAEILRRLIIKKTDDGVLMILYGHNLFSQGYYTLAARALRKGIGLIKGFEDTPMELEEFYSKPETLRKKITELEDWVKFKPDDKEARFLLGYIYFFTGNPEKSRPLFEGLREENADDKITTKFITKIKELLKSSQFPPPKEK